MRAHWADAVTIVAVLWCSVKDSMVWSAPPILGLLWCAIVSMIAVAASAIATRIGEALAAEVGLPDCEDPVAAQFR